MSEFNFVVVELCKAQVQICCPKEGRGTEFSESLGMGGGGIKYFHSDIFLLAILYIKCS